MAGKIKLIDNWKKAHKFGSIRWSVIGFVTMFIDSMYSSWFSIPPHILAKIPNGSTIGTVLFAIVIVARIVSFVRTSDDGDVNN